ncbi:MAG: glucose-6-phosphate dehydrogenase, partial [Tepidiformaceae bacterium]
SRHRRTAQPVRRPCRQASVSLGPPEAQDVVVIGATGDLARRKLLPALYNLHLGGLLPESGKIIGYARSELSTADFQKLAFDAVGEFSRTKVTAKRWAPFARRLEFVSGTTEGLAGVRERCSLSERLVYLSVPPSVFASSVRELGDAGLVEGTRLVVEKPFGHDLASSRELADTIHSVFSEKQIFRIDHYLGKETVQNILVFRFGNAVFERVWTRDAIDHVQFTVAESIGIESRGAFYEETGALRDILQNHVLQVLALLTMEPPSSFAPESVRDEKFKLFQAIRPLKPEDLVRGQYGPGQIAGSAVAGYRDESGVNPLSTTETFAAARLHIDNWRWSGVPFFLRTGKRLPIRSTEVTVVFRPAPVPFFASTGVDALDPNVLTIRIQPEEAIEFRFLAKVPGPEISVQQVDMGFSYDQAFKVKPAEAYERLLHDAMDGDHTLFARADSVDRAWEVVQPLLEALPPVHPYPAGAWGPPQADELISPRVWGAQ